MVRITSPYFVAGYDLRNNRIAPIIKYMKNWSIEKIKNYCQKKQWEIEILEEKLF